MSLPNIYKRAAFKEKGGPLVLEDVPLVPPSQNEILVKVEACGVCHSDAVLQNGGYVRPGFPKVPGHELIGRVVAVGERVSDWKIGDRAGGAWHAGHDGTCYACRNGFYQMCDTGDIHGETRDGGYAEYCKIRAEAAIRIPEHVDAAKYAPILCAGVTVFNAMRKMKIPPGETVSIQGLGGLGHLAIQYANKFGYRVVVISRGNTKEKFARELGAHEYIDTNNGDPGVQLQKLGKAAMVVTTASSSDAISPLLKGLNIRGKLLILGIVGDVSIDTGAMVTYGLSVHAWPSGHALDSEEAIKFTELENINCMVEEFPLEKVNEAFNAMMSGSVRFRAVLTMN